MSNKIERIDSETLLVGIDIAKHTHWAQMTDSRGITLSKPLRVENTAEGMNRLKREALSLMQKSGLTKIMIGFEPSGHYWRALAWFFHTADGFQLVGVNPYHVKQLKELDDNSQTKTDQKDALVIARLLRDGRYFDLYMPDEEYANLRVLRRHRDQILERRKWIQNQLISIMDEYFPEYEEAGFSVTCTTSRYALYYTPFPSEIDALGEDGLLQLWRHHYPNYHHLRGKFAHRLFLAAQDSIGVTYGIEATRQRIRDLLSLHMQIDQQIAECEAGMEAIMDTIGIQDYLLSIPGVGKNVSAIFVAETGDLSRFESWKQIQKLAGLNLVEQSSGQHKGHAHISKRGRAGLRCVIYQIGDKGMLVNPEMRQYYNYLRHRQVNQLKHQQAILAVGIKMMRIMFFLAKNHKYYDPDQALGEVRRQQIQSIA